AATWSRRSPPTSCATEGGTAIMMPITATIASVHTLVPTATAPSVTASRWPASTVSITFMPTAASWANTSGKASRAVVVSSPAMRARRAGTMGGIGYSLAGASVIEARPRLARQPPAGSARRAVRSQRDPRRATIVNDNALPNVPAERAVDLPDPPPACPNCGAPQLGPYCYECGQQEKGPVRYQPDILRDLSALAFNVDSRIFRSLWVMYVRPGFLTTEYFAGRRKRYSSPFRMFFVLCIVAFLAMQLYV